MSRIAVRAGRLVASVALVVVATPMPAHADGLPFNDPNVKGFLALCDQHNQPVTHGVVNARPFLWKAISSTPMPKAYSGAGQNTTLVVYQPRKGIDPGDWSGDAMTGESLFNGSYPAAVSTYADIALSEVVAAFPPQWDGLYQLRLQLGKANYGLYNGPYAATVIQVTGNTWHVVQGGNLPCTQGSAVSTETKIGIGLKPKKGQLVNTGANMTPPGGTSSNGTTGGGATPTANGPFSAPLVGTDGGGGLGLGVILAIAAAAVLLPAGAVGWVARRRNTSSPQREHQVTNHLRTAARP